MDLSDLNEEDLSIVVEDKTTGSIMESSISYDDGKNNETWLGMMKSAVVLTVIKGSDDTRQVDLLNDRTDIKIDYTGSGFNAGIKFPTYGFSMKLQVELTDDGLTACIPDESIEETDDEYQIGTIAMYPFLGNSYLDSKPGYMLIPDGNGALIYLDDKEGAFQSGYVAPIYGKDAGFEENGVVSLLWDKYEMVTDAENIIAPIYGIAHTEDEMGLLGIAEEGAMRANIEAYPNGANVDYNRAFVRFIKRKLYTQPTSNNSTTGSFQMVEPDRSHSDIKVRYIFLTGNDADYAGMATAYRNYLLDKGEIEIKDSSYRTRVDFLGTDRESWLLGTKSVVMTTADDVREIYNDLKSNGTGNLITLYKGWQKGGVFDLPVSSYRADGAIGGTSDLSRLIKDSSAEGDRIYLYTDALRINPDEHNVAFNVVKQVNKRRYYEKTYKDVYEQFMFQTPERAGKMLDQLASGIAGKGTANLCVGGLSDNLFSFSYSGNAYSRFYIGEIIEQTLDSVNEKAELMLEQPFAYLWHDTDAFLDMPLYTSNFILEDRSVPFLSLVLKGVMPVYSEYTNFEANKSEFFLKLIETGTYPSFLITKESSSKLIYTNSNDIYSSEYSAYKDTIVRYDSELSEFSKLVDKAFITDHEIIGDVTVVTYDNGVKVYINYGSTEQKVDSVKIAPMSYEVIPEVAE